MSFVKKLTSQVWNYFKKLNTGSPGVFRNCEHGKITLYASCFALMTFHYLNLLQNYDENYLEAWGNCLLRFQQDNGYFIGPEISKGALLSSAHNKEHIAMHCTAHVLPALKILDKRPRYSLSFARNFADIGWLERWLLERNMEEPWLEGNNLLFIGQFLTYLYEEEGISKAKDAIIFLFDWLDDKVDRSTGLWGKVPILDKYRAVYGAYHQLLLYYYWGREIKYSKQLVDTVLSLQHFDGGFAKGWGGGSCEDVDCVDILVNMYKRSNYRRRDIEDALLKAAFAVLRRQARDGGFVYRIGEEFYHMGMEYTYAPAGRSNAFSTWFGVHTLALISEIISIPKLSGIDFQFNTCCSMGWHNKWKTQRAGISSKDLFSTTLRDGICRFYFLARNLKKSSGILGKLYQLCRNAQLLPERQRKS